MTTTAPNLDIALSFNKHGGTFSMPHRGYMISFRFRDISEIGTLLTLHGVRFDDIREVEERADRAFARHCRAMRGFENSTVRRVHGAGIVLGVILGVPMWWAGIKVILSWWS